MERNYKMLENKSEKTFFSELIFFGTFKEAGIVLK